MTVLCPGWAGASCCPWLSSLLGTIVLAVAWVSLGRCVAEKKRFPGENNPSRGCVPGPVTLLGPCASSQGLCSDGCQYPMGVSIPWCSVGLDPAQGPGAVSGVGATRLFQAGVFLPPRVAPLGQASSLPSVSMPGVQQEDFHCC